LKKCGTEGKNKKKFKGGCTLVPGDFVLLIQIHGWSKGSQKRMETQGGEKSIDSSFEFKGLKRFYGPEREAVCLGRLVR